MQRLAGPRDMGMRNRKRGHAQREARSIFAGAPLTDMNGACTFWPTVVDLFCGCGGVTLGFERKRFRVVAAVDNDPIACDTYRQNHQSVYLYERDINDVDPRQIRVAQLKGNDLDVLAVCAPCQPFSGQNRKAGQEAQARLVLHAVRFAKVLRPTIILFENVPGFVRARFEPLLEELREGLRRNDYVVDSPRNIDAADYGVPQRRLRCIMLAKRGGPPPCLPNPITPVGLRTTVFEAIGDLPPLTSGRTDQNDPLHFARAHQPIALARLAHINRDGGSRDTLPSHLVLDCHKNYRGHPDVYGRMSWQDVAPTLTTGCTDLTRGRFAHPRDDRAITLREAARLQTFPDTYRFAGSPKGIATQIGNAVPPRLIEALVPIVRNSLKT